MILHDYKTIPWFREDVSWVDEIPAIPGCHALMDTRERALEELSRGFEIVAHEYRERNLLLPAGNTEIIYA